METNEERHIRAINRLDPVITDEQIEYMKDVIVYHYHITILKGISNGKDMRLVYNAYHLLGYDVGRGKVKCNTCSIMYYYKIFSSVNWEYIVHAMDEKYYLTLRLIFPPNVAKNIIFHMYGDKRKDKWINIPKKSKNDTVNYNYQKELDVHWIYHMHEDFKVPGRP